MNPDRIELQSQMAFAARLARGLVADENVADDVVQDTWVSVLQRPPRDPDGVRAYLATSLRRTASRFRRGEERRARREASAARAEALPSESDLAASLELHQRIVQAVLELAEPARSAVLARFFEDLPPREIARRTGEPVETVRTRLKRALAELRRVLDRSEGGRASWAALALPLAAKGGASVAIPMSSATPTSGLLGALLMKTHLQLALVVALAVTAGLVWKARSAEPRTPPSAKQVREGTVAARLKGSADEVTASVAQTETERRSSVPVATPVAAQPEQRAGFVEGRVRVVDMEGREHEEESGSFMLERSGQPDTIEEIVVERGRFELAAEGASSVTIVSLELGGRPAFLDEPLVALPDEGLLELVVHRPPASVLTVIDARSGHELEDVFVVRGPTRFRNSVHPGPWEEHEVYADGAASPIELVSTGAEESWWVHAPGYAWGWIHFDHRRGGERRVALEPGAGPLEIELDPFDPALNLRVHLFPPGWERSHGSLVSAIHPQEARVVFDGLPIGEVQVRAELGIWHNGPHELDRATVRLEPGVERRVRLDLEAQGRLPAAVPLEGRIVLPTEHPDLEPRFAIRPADGAARRRADHVYSASLELHPVPGKPNARRFDAGRVTPGPYLFIWSSLQYWEAFEVGPDRAAEVEIRIPQLGRVRVIVRDERTGERVRGHKLTWSRPKPKSLASWTMSSVEENAAGEYEFLAPLGRLYLHSRDSEFDAGGLSIDVVPGVQEHVLTVRDSPGAWVRLMDGDAIVPIEWSWGLAAKDTQGDARTRVARIEEGRAWIATEAPGIFVLEFPERPELELFEPIPAQTLVVHADESPELVVALRRRTP